MKKVIQTLFLITMFSGIVLSSSIVSADDDSVVDEINITVPISCTISGTGMNTHNANINNGIYTPDIGTTTLHAFCNDSEGFAIYAAGYTGDEVGGTNSNKLVGTNASNNATIETGLATTAGNPDISNWAMKLAITQDSGDITGTNVFTIDSAPNVSGGADASFSQYHVVPNEYTKVAHKDSNTDMTTSTGGVKLTTTYAAYISKMQPADTYSGQVVYTLIHPSSAVPLSRGQVGVIYHANGSTFVDGATTNEMVYTSQPMYIATTPTILETSNLTNGKSNGAYASDEYLDEKKTFPAASRIKVVVDYGSTADTSYISISSGSFFVTLSDVGTRTYTINNDNVSIIFSSWDVPEPGYDYGMFVQLYPIYESEVIGTESTMEYLTMAANDGIYALPNDWNGSWYADIGNRHYDFINETEVGAFLADNITTLGGINVDLYRGLTFSEAYSRVGNNQDGGYYRQQDLNNSVCQMVAITQNQTVKDVRDNNVYMVGKLKDGNCWMLDNLALDLTDSTITVNMSASNTNATQAAITNLLNGGSTTVGWSSTAVANVTANFASYTAPMINKTNKDTLVTSYGPAAVEGQAKVGIYYNYCAATMGTYCYVFNDGPDVLDTRIDAPQDICPVNWRMPTDDEYAMLYMDYYKESVATDISSLQYNLSTPLSGYFVDSSTRDKNSSGYWWSSSYHHSSDMYYLQTWSNASGVTANHYRDYGHSVRCLVSE